MFEEASIISCAGAAIVAIHHIAETPVAIGMVIIVGGPQYRVGNHRKFIELARFLSNNGVSSLRFDYRGMGDSKVDPRFRTVV